MAHFHNILVNIDGQAPEQPALAYAVELAKASGAALKVVDVIPDFSWPARLLVGGYERVIEMITHTKSGRLQALAEEISEQGVRVSTKLLNAPSSANIIREVMRDEHDLVVRQAKGRASRRPGSFGTTATRLMRKCPCPVLILKNGGQPSCKPVVAAVDAVPDDEVHAQLNQQILEMARLLCPPETCRMDVVYVWSVYGESILKEHMQKDEFRQLWEKTESEAQQRLHALVNKVGMSLSDENVHSWHGDAGLEIPKFLEERDVGLLVMGTVARAGLAGLLIGNTAERILNRVTCSVLAIKPADFVSPIREAV